MEKSLHFVFLCALLSLTFIKGACPKKLMKLMQPFKSDEKKGFSFVSSEGALYVIMPYDMKCQMTRNIKWHEMSNDTKCQMILNVKWHKMSNSMKCQMAPNVKW